MKFKILIFSLLSGTCLQALAGAIVTYHGRILKADSSALEGSAVVFKIQVRSPGATSCLLYEETRTLDMHASGGIFAIPIGDGNGVRTGSDPGITIENVFSNNIALNFTGLNCNSGTSYAPTSLDARRLVVSFDDGSGSGVQLLAPMDINYVPLALHALEAQTALKVGSTPAANVMTVSGPASALTPSNFTELLALVNGTSTTYAKTSSSVGGDLSGTIASANVVKLQGRAVSSSAPSSNDVLTWNGTAWAPATGGGGAVSSVAGRTGAVVLANTDISGLGDSATKNVGTTAGTVAAGDDARFGTASVFTGSFTGDVTGTQSSTVVSAVGGSTAANVHNAELLANSATSANTASTIVRRDASGDFVSRDASLRSVILRDSGSKNITMVTPATLTNSYTLTWPLDKGTLNQVLTTDASGNLSWATPASAGVSSVTSGGAPIVIGGTGSAPTVSVSAATDSTSGVVTLAADGGTTASTVVQATDARLSNARAPSGNAGGDLGSTYPNPTVTGLKGAAITYTSLTTGDFLKYDGSAWVNTTLSSASLSNDSNLLKASNMPANCSASQALTFSSPTGTWVCSNIASLDAGVITTGTIADNRLPASATYWQAATGGINYAGGNVGIGTTAPDATLHIAGASGTTLKIVDGNQALGRVLTSDANGVASWQASAAGGINLQSFSTSGTWTKPSSGTVAHIQCWGGGGSGARSNVGFQYVGGGGGGGYATKEVLLSGLPATVSVTIGAGGAGLAGNGTGNVGGNSTFGAYLTAYGGAGGIPGGAGTGGGGGGGGPLGPGSGKLAGAPCIAGGDGDGGAPSCQGQGFDYESGAGGIFHGGGGGAGSGLGAGGSSVYGGGGGAGIYTNGSVAKSGGQSMSGGAGGASASGNAVSGSVPGGGGGASANGTSGSGGAGQCIIKVF